MGTYGISADEFIDKFEVCLRSMEGEVCAETVAQSWNKLARKYKWEDRLLAHDKDIRFKQRDDENKG